MRGFRLKSQHRQRTSLLPEERWLSAVREQAARLQGLESAAFTRAAWDVRDGRDTSEVALQTSFAFALEAVRRSTGKTFYDVQLMAGSVLAGGRLAEMATGEGKTLVTMLPVVHAAMNGSPVHVSTTNSYLAARDCDELQGALELLGMRVALLPEDNDDTAKRSAYAADITYGTGYEFGFDYLRDQLKLREHPEDRLGDTWLRKLTGAAPDSASLVQSAREVSVVDEIDSVLIDEANTPLVISFFNSDQTDDRPFQLAARSAALLNEDQDYEVDQQQGKIALQASGEQKISEQRSATIGLPLQRPWTLYVEQALRAQHLLQRNADYVVQHDKVALVDQQTGRIFPERKWRDGLHQAVELAEGVPLSPETSSFARISRQRFFQTYRHATGMTGTAADAITEFQTFFQLDVVRIPLHRPSQRLELPARAFVDDDARAAAIVESVREHRDAGQPVLIGTRTIEQSSFLADALKSARIEHQVLNGLQDADEAAIVADAGQAGRVTVATNMAGRGTDIRICERAREAGGLHVIVAEPNRSHRVDRQLKGRCARQGDPGTCEVLIAATDDLLQSEGKSLAAHIRRSASRQGRSRLKMETELLKLQRRAEHTDFLRRQHLLRQSLWIESLLDTLVGSHAQQTVTAGESL